MWFVPDGPKPLVAVTAAVVMVAGLGIAGTVAARERTVTGTPVTECVATGNTERECALQDDLELVADIVDLNRLFASVSPAQTAEANLSNFRIAYCDIAKGRDMDVVLLGESMSFRDIARGNYGLRVAENQFPPSADDFDDEVADACH